MGLDLIDIVAVILGVLFSIRKLDAQRRTQREFPHVEKGAFSDWQRREVATYSVGMFACFAKVLAKLFLVYVLYDMISYRALRMAGMTVDVSWLYFTLLTLFRGHQLVKLRSSLGIVLGGMIVSSGSSELSDELKQALLVLDDGDVDGAVYRFQQISLDADESHKAIALYWLGECYVRQNKLDEARDAFLEALEADPTLMQPKEALQHLEDPKSQ